MRIPIKAVQHSLQLGVLSSNLKNYILGKSFYRRQTVFEILNNKNVRHCAKILYYYIACLTPDDAKETIMSYRLASQSCSLIPVLYFVRYIILFIYLQGFFLFLLKLCSLTILQFTLIPLHIHSRTIFVVVLQPRRLSVAGHRSYGSHRTNSSCRDPCPIS